MMLHKLPVLLVPLVLLSPALSHGDSSDPSNYDECILDALRGVSSDVAAQAIIDSCRRLYPEAPQAAAPQAAPPPPPAPAPVGSVAEPAAASVPAPQAQAAPPAAPAPLDTTGARALTADELAKLRAAAKVFGDAYRVTVVNDNPNLTLTEVTIAVWDETDLGATREEYSEPVQIGPQTSAMVKYAVRYRGQETGWRWGVVAARGVE
jgi:hypothetical protein